ncbi:MAG: gyrase, subunit [Haloplasmataceae bacterium]|jgi:DNA gyrase subunit A|nr:gyrase, subunit [Haloplasmataceae bacterium]
MSIENQTGEIIKDINISREVKTSFLNYSMSVIVQRALPDVRDGLKPVHRRILFGMYELGSHSDKPFKKSARIVGDVMGKFHPHGDSSIYDAMVRMAQDFNYRYMLVEGHGNFGSVDGDGAAAMRYTEARLSKIAMELLRDINKDTIEFKDNYDGSEQEPQLLPARFPNLLVNGSTGIAVGMATNIPPHNLGEVIDGVLALAHDPELSVADLMEYIKGPDFPTGGTILGKNGIRRAYEFGRGSILVRAKYEVIENNKKNSIIITEIPYQVNKSRLIEKIADLAKEKRIEGITDLRDESNRNGMRIVLELRRDVNPEVLLNNLFKYTSLQTTFSVNMLALVDYQPKVLNLKQVLMHYLNHQKDVIVRRTKYDLDKALAKAHLLEGYRIALENIDRIIIIIRQSPDENSAVSGLINEFVLTDIQAKAIVDLRLKRLTGLEREKIETEYQELLVQITEYKAILANEEKVLEIVKTELIEVKDKYNDKRRTEIIQSEEFDLEDEDLIPVQDIIISVTNRGYIKRLPVDTYKSQNRGGVGIKGVPTYEDDFVEHMIYTTTHHKILVFSNLGKVYELRGFTIPEYSRNAKGMPIINLLNFEDGEKLRSIIAIKEYDPNHFLIFTTIKGVVKRTQLQLFANIRTNGIRAININDDDELLAVRLTDGDREIIIGSSNGKLVRFNENNVRSMGRTATGVRGINLEKNENVVGMDVIEGEDQYILSISELGYGKLTSISEYRLVNRGGKGVKTINVTEKNGQLVTVRTVSREKQDLLIVTNKGMIIRLPLTQVSVTGRAAQGVKLINLKDDQLVASGAILPSDEEISNDPIQIVQEININE